MVGIKRASPHVLDAGNTGLMLTARRNAQRSLPALLQLPVTNQLLLKVESQLTALCILSNSPIMLGAKL